MKLADVVLLGYPLQREMPQIAHQNDLSIYAKVNELAGTAGFDAVSGFCMMISTA